MGVMREIHRLAAAPVETTLLQVPRALVVSVLALLVDVGIYEVLLCQFGLHAVPAAVIGYLAGGVVQYVLCSWWVFSASPGNHAVGLLTFGVLSLIGLGITCAVVYVLHDLGHVNELVAKLAAVALAFIWNFLSRKTLLFKGAHRSDKRRPRPAAVEDYATSVV